MGVDVAALVVEDSSVAALASADEEDDVVGLGKAAYVGHAVCDLTADGVGVFEIDVGADVGLDVVYDLAEAIETHGGLAVEADGCVHVETADFAGAFDDDGGALGLADEAEDFGVSVFAEDDDLLGGGGLCAFLVFFAYAVLEVEDDGTGGVDNVYVLLLGLVVGGGGLAVGTEQDVAVVELVELVVVNGLQAHVLQTVALGAVVYDIAEAVELLTVFEFVFRLAYGAGHSEAETASFVNFNNHACCWGIVMLVLSSTMASGAWVRGEISRWLSM